MSYSFSRRAATKTEVVEAVKTEFAAVVKGQPAHKLDAPIVIAAVEAVVKAMREPTDTEQIEVAASGHVEAVPGAAEIEHVELNALAARFVPKD